jgi:hypothetical protein
MRYLARHYVRTAFYGQSSGSLVGALVFLALLAFLLYLAF